MRIPLLPCALVALPEALTPATQREGVIVNLYDVFGKAPRRLPEHVYKKDGETQLIPTSRPESRLQPRLAAPPVT